MLIFMELGSGIDGRLLRRQAAEEVDINANSVSVKAEGKLGKMCIEGIGYLFCGVL